MNTPFDDLFETDSPAAGVATKNRLSEIPDRKPKPRRVGERSRLPARSSVPETETASKNGRHARPETALNGSEVNGSVPRSAKPTERNGAPAHTPSPPAPPAVNCRPNAKTSEVERPVESATELAQHPPDAAPAETEEAPPAAELLKRHEVIQRWNKQAAVLENVFFPAQMLESFSLGDSIDVASARLFLIRFRTEAGEPRDAIEKLLMDQLIVAHLKIGELYSLAATVPQLDFKALYTSAATRLLSTICQVVATLAAYRKSTGRRRTRGPNRGQAARLRAGGQNGRKAEPTKRTKKTSHRNDK
jgi:hypothetical protein